MNLCDIPLAAHERRPVAYPGLTLTVEVEPGEYECCWLRLRHQQQGIDAEFELSVREVAGLIACLQEWQQNLRRDRIERGGTMTWLLKLLGLCLARPWRWWRWAGLADDICHALFDWRSDTFNWHFRLCQLAWGTWYEKEGSIP